MFILRNETFFVQPNPQQRYFMCVCVQVEVKILIGSTKIMNRTVFYYTNLLFRTLIARAHSVVRDLNEREMETILYITKLTLNVDKATSESQCFNLY